MRRNKNGTFINLYKEYNLQCTYEEYRAITKCYDGMLRRCYKEGSNGYNRYGGRGIEVCQEWLDNKWNFITWADGKYKKGLTLDRIDVNKNYEPENCRFADKATQSRNKSSNIYINYNGEKMVLKDYAKIKGIKYTTIHAQYQKGKLKEMIWNEH